MPVNISINTNTVAVEENINHISVNDPNNPNIVDITQPVTEIIEIITAGPIGPKGDIGPAGPSGSAVLSGGDNNFIPLWSGSTNLTSSIARQTSGTLQISGSTSITGSLSVTNGITGSLFGTSSNSTSASYSLSSSYSNNSTSASYSVNATNAATASNILGGKATHIPYFITDTTLATSSIYQSGSTSVIINQDNNTEANPEALYVWQPHPTSINVISGKGNLNNYLQLNINNTNQGTNASSDIVATANNGDETTNYIDMGINSENYNSGFIGDANDAYLYSTGQHLHIGNITPNKPIQFFVGGPDSNADRKLELNANGQHNITGSLEISGSLKVNQGITGSLFGSASYSLSSSRAISSSYATTASYILQAVSSSYASNALSASYVANYVLTAATASMLSPYVLTSSTSSMTVLSASYANNSDFSVTATNATSASHATIADSATFATTAGNGGVTSIIAGSGITLPFGGTGAVTIVAAGGGGGVTIISGSAVTSSFVNSDTWTFNHNLGTRTPTITVFDTSYNQIIPQNIFLDTTASAIITFPTLESGFAIASTGGTSGTALSASYSLFSTYAASASYFPETDPVFVSKSGSLATTGSNTFRGIQTVTGSLFTSGSNTLIGNTVLTGSFSVSGSTLQTGNNTLIGNTVLSGSISVSGSQDFKGDFDLTGSFTITGSTVQIGNNTLTGDTSLTGSIAMTGSILIFGDVLPQVSSSYNLGSLTQPWKSIYVQSGSINIQSDIPGGANAELINLGGDVSIKSAGFRVVSGSYTPFRVDTTGRTILIVPNIPANDIGAFSIIGNPAGSYQPVINPSGMIHVTSNDAQAARVTVDGFGTNIGAIYVGRHARGTAALPTPTLSGDVLVRFAGLGYATSSYFPVVGAVPTSLEFQATENYSTSSYGSRAAFYTYANGATSRSLSATIDSTGIQTSGSVVASSFTGSLFGTSSWAISSSNAQTASYVLQAVSSSYSSTASYAPNYLLLSQTGSFATTGSNIFIGNQIITGSLTLNSGSALNINDGFFVNGHKQFQYASFYHTASQTLTSATTPLPFQFSTIENNSGAFTVALSGSRRSRITTNTTGWWNVQYSAQATNGSSFNNYDSYTWIRVNETNVINSNNIRTIPQDSFDLLASRNTLIYLESGSYFEIMYGAASTQVSFPYTATATSPTRPATPSISLVVTQHA
jgi:hypothetical protein